MTEPVTKLFSELSTTELYEFLRLRVDTFVVEQTCAYPELDGKDCDSYTRHIWLRDDNDTMSAYLRLLHEGEGHYRIGRVCTARSARRQGLAAILMRHAIVLCGDSYIVLDAQTAVMPFYNELGFSAIGDVFLEDGIPHITMVNDKTRRTRA